MPIRGQAVTDHDPHGGLAVPTETERYLNQSQGTGSLLPDGTRRYFETRFSADFRAVRVHDDDTAGQVAKSIGALAFTRGRDIWFSAGSYDTATDGGRRLLAHELAHVAQQNPGIGLGLQRQAVMPVGPDPRSSRASRLPGVQRQTPTAPARAEAAIVHDGVELTEDAAYLDSVLERITAERGADGADTFVKTFVNMPTENKLRLQLSGHDPDAIERLQKALEIAGVRWENSCERFMKTFEDEAIALTRSLLDGSEKEINDQMHKLVSSSWGVATITPENQENLQAAAHDLATKRREANKAGNQALKSQKALQDARAAMPLLPPPTALTDTFEADRATWSQLEKEYAMLRSEKQRDQPILAAYSDNEDGNAVERLDGLAGHGTGFLGRANLAGELIQESNKKLHNIAEVRAGLGGEFSIWKQPRILSLTEQKLNASAMQGRLVADRSQKIREAEERSAGLRTAVAIGLGIALAVVSLGGAGLAAAGFAAEASFIGALAAYPQAFLAGMSIAAAYETLNEYSLEVAAAGTAYDKAKAIAADEPSMLWLALALVTAGLEVMNAAALFAELKVLLAASKKSGDIEAIAELVESKAPQAGRTIMPRAIADAEASGAIRPPRPGDLELPMPGETPEQYYARTNPNDPLDALPALRNTRLAQTEKNMQIARIQFGLRNPNAIWTHYETAGGYEAIMRGQQLRSGSGVPGYSGGDAVRANLGPFLPGPKREIWYDFKVPNPPVEGYWRQFFSGPGVAWPLPAGDMLPVEIVRVAYPNGAIAERVSGGWILRSADGSTSAPMTLDELLAKGERP